MRIVHTADWHLGRIFHGVHMTEDQAVVLDQLVDAVAELQPDCVVVAGDLYDRAVPPPEAVALLDDVFSRLVRELGVSVLVVAGNHDSPERLGFGGRLLESARLFVVGRLDPRLEPVVVLDEHGPVAFHLLPFVEPAQVRERFAADPLVAHGPSANSVDGHGSALAHLVARARRNHPRGMRGVVVAHGSVTGVTEAESERPLWVGTHAAEASVFAPFAYAALGHHHRAQDLDGPRVRYPGSLLAYSFSEAGEPRTLTVVDLDEEGRLERQLVPLTPRHEVRVVEGTLAALLKAAPSEDYLKVVLTDDGPVLDPAGRLRERFPNLLQLEQARLLDEQGGDAARVDVTRLGDRELFDAFFEEVTGEAPGEAEREAFLDVVAAVDRAAREASGS